MISVSSRPNYMQEEYSTIMYNVIEGRRQAPAHQETQVKKPMAVPKVTPEDDVVSGQELETSSPECNTAGASAANAAVLEMEGSIDGWVLTTLCCFSVALCCWKKEALQRNSPETKKSKLKVNETNSAWQESNRI